MDSINMPAGRRGQSGPARMNRRVRRTHRGQALVEFALIIPVMLFLLLAAIDFGRLFFSYIEVTNAAREASAYAAIDPTVPQANINARAGQEANSQSQGGEGTMTVGAPLCQTAAAPPVTVSCATAASTNGGTGNQVTIAVSRPFTFMTPIIGAMFGTMTLGASATAPVYDPPVVPATPAPTPSADPCTLTADFTFDQSGKNSPITFDASDSTPQSGSCKIVSYSWKFDDTNPPSGTYDTMVSVTTASHDYGNGAGNWGKTHFVTLKVTNGGGQTAIFQQVVLTLSN